MESQSALPYTSPVVPSEAASSESDQLTPPLTARMILLAVVAEFKIHPPYCLSQPKRPRSISRARGVAMTLMRVLLTEENGTPLSYPQIGNAFGGMNHSSVITACRQMHKRVLNDGRYGKVNPWNPFPHMQAIANALGVNLPPPREWPISRVSHAKST